MIDNEKLERLLTNVKDARTKEKETATVLVTATASWKSANEELNAQNKVLADYWREFTEKETKP